MVSKKIICYYGSWATYRHGDGKFNIEDIDPTLCTHAVYSFVGLNSDGTINILDRWNDIDLKGFERFVALKNRSPNLKVMVAIGGWNQGSSTYSQVFNSLSLRTAFVDDAVAFLQKYKFDGLDIDWEYPAERGGSPSDREAFSALIKELKEKFSPHGFLLSAAVGVTANHRTRSYEISKLCQYLDFINLMTYDIHGSWESVTGEVAPLYDQNADLSVAGLVDHWISAGADPNKLIIGIPLYGRTFTLANPANNGVGAQSAGPGNPGQLTNEAGILSYTEICRNRWPETWDNARKVPYAFQNNQWVGYENIKSVGLKAQLAIQKNLGGVMVWAIDYDDKSGQCGNGTFPLMRSIHSNIG